MSTSSGPIVPINSAVSPADPTEKWVTQLGSLLQELESVSAATRDMPPVVSPAVDGQLIQARLGAAAGLYAALRCKHPPSAGHSLRVALVCSAWAQAMKLPDDECDLVELASLLHDVGVVGVPEAILQKPGPLDPEEAALMDRARRMSLDILQQFCRSSQLLEIVEHVGARYDGCLSKHPRKGPEIPLGARMITIVEAFDAMTTDHVYRPARSHERALAELFECAGTQFDPELVQSFAGFHQNRSSDWRCTGAQRWLRELDPAQADAHWSLNPAPRPVALPEDSLFQSKLLENMYDAVLFIDSAGVIKQWNRGAERLTGIAAASIRQCRWTPELLSMADERGHLITEADCPVSGAIRSGVQSLRRLTISGRSGRTVAVDTHAIPVTTPEGTTLGAILLFHDASSEITLEQRCHNLHNKATKDPLTQAANRAEFDRVFEMFVAAHQQQNVPCSLIMCDIDRFKSVNDTFGHQAGDEAIKSLAALLKSSCRPGDLVARYGGEEFVLLCADCDNAAAARRAEEIRQALERIAQPQMGGKTISASFGVTEIQPGDSPETMLRRADRALLTAKANGRNQVVQLGSGPAENEADEKSSFFWPFQSSKPKELVEQTLYTPVPLKIAVEKLRGFVADHRAAILKADGDQVQLQIDELRPGGFRRLTDRPATFQMQITFEEYRRGKTTDDPGVTRTRMHVCIAVRRNRDRRRSDLSAKARDILTSFRSYLMASSDEDAAVENDRKPWRFFPWMSKKG